MARDAPRPPRRTDHSGLPARRQPGRVAEQTRRHREADLVAVVCADCGADLATVAVGAEAYCRRCQTWTSSLAVDGNAGVVG